MNWTDQPYKWQVNDGEEVFVVLDGAVEMLFKENGIQHAAYPRGEARILVVESEGSV